MNMPPRVLVIAGSDSGGGAGIQADIKTITMLGGFAMTAITAITSQNTQGVRAVHPVPVEHILSQFDAVMDDLGADIIKTGMLHSVEVIEAVADRLTHSGIPAVIDPVMVATSGARLLEPGAVGVLKSTLMPCADLVTPNVPEAEILADMPVHSCADMEEAARRISALGAKAVLVKGGHLEDADVHDLLFANGQMHWYQCSRIPTRHTHGTGCTLASAIATHVGAGLPLHEAVAKASRFVHAAIAAAPGFGAGSGPINHMHALVRHEGE